ncbi:ParB/RepB/Spo0J family partition protein [Streptomyces hyaluromycini]|uniref:ParB/RepB/Spo0J family partition protein n=1 Tax=Streptomyces hyaluromycini TaxID=1377993 RepID=UPI00142DF4D9|nr:ParB/RepB/Spo0J family partition protein [Streptomyces hyaluromycini]
MTANQVVPVPVPHQAGFDIGPDAGPDPRSHKGIDALPGEGPDTGSDTSYDSLLALRDTMLREGAVELVPLAGITVTDTPRTAGVDGKWALTLSELDTELPPIVVHRPTMTVIDGMHRLRAAQLRGRDRIAVRFFEGSAQDAALLAVAMNIVHGRPLSQADRAAAVERIVRMHPYWSDRAIAVIAGLSAKKVSEIRRRSGDPVRGERRIGLDGRARPLNTVRGRELAGELLRADPTASLRTVARKAGISPVTVADVRNRLLRGDDPVTPRQRLAARRGSHERSAPQQNTDSKSPNELFIIFDSLRRDPSLRLTEAGRTVLRMLEACSLMVRDRRQIIASLPPHCTGQMAALAGGYSELWRVFADELRACEE